MYRSSSLRALALTLAALLVSAACGGAPGAPAAPAATVATATAAPTVAAFKPAGPVEFVVHTAAGGGMDRAGRAWIDILQKDKLIEETWTVNNQSGGSGAKAMAYLFNQKGKTNVIAGMTTTWLATPLESSEVQNSYKDFTPVARMVTEKLVAAVRADSPYKDLNDFIAAAKAQPGKLNQTGGSVTAIEALCKAVIEKETGAKWNYLSFPGGGERIAALLGGTAQIMFGDPAEFSEQVRGGRLRVIATIGQERSVLYKDARTLAEHGLRADVPTQTRGVLAPPGTAPGVVAYYAGVLKRLTETAGWKTWVEQGDLQTAYIAGADFGKFLDAENTKLAALIKEVKK